MPFDTWQEWRLVRVSVQTGARSTAGTYASRDRALRDAERMGGGWYSLECWRVTRGDFMDRVERCLERERIYRDLRRPVPAEVRAQWAAQPLDVTEDVMTRFEDAPYESALPDVLPDMGGRYR